LVQDYNKESYQLAQAFTKRDFDVIVGIADKGIDIARIFSKYLEIALLRISARRYFFYNGKMRDIREFDDETKYPNLTDIMIDEFKPEGMNEAKAVKKFKEYWYREIYPTMRIQIKEIDDLTLIKNKKVLVVDDTASSGNTIRKVVRYLDSFKPKLIRTLVIVCEKTELYPTVINYAFEK
jgi:hypoxanthine phosphoribosyltransferase